MCDSHKKPVSHGTRLTGLIFFCTCVDGAERAEQRGTREAEQLEGDWSLLQACSKVVRVRAHVQVQVQEEEQVRKRLVIALLCSTVLRCAVFSIPLLCCAAVLCWLLCLTSIRPPTSTVGWPYHRQSGPKC